MMQRAKSFMSRAIKMFMMLGFNNRVLQVVAEALTE